MKNVLLKFAGLFVERVPVDERGNPLPPPPKGAAPTGPTGGAPHGSAPAAPGAVPMPAQGQPGTPPMQGMPMAPGSAQTAPALGAPPGGGAPIAVALRAWVPQEYAAHLAPFGVHVIAAGGSVTSEQARGWGADVLVVSAECLGQDMHLLQQPQLPTVFITPQPVMIPDVPGVVQVQEPLRASDVAQAAREASGAFAAARG
ncbi:MAG: hypothetical protein JWM98_1019 [Thermoleophilia bacterium]|nr:hypothetical protein [Thermoleophilia bacterium]